MILTVQELHIGLDLALQYINSSRIKRLKDEEKDFLLNETLIELIHTKINPKSNIQHEGLEDTQKRYDDLAILKSLPTTLPCYYLDDETAFSLLPQDYFHLINDKTYSYYNCNGITKTYNPSTFGICGYIWNVPTLEYPLTEFKITLNSDAITIFDLANTFHVCITNSSMFFYLVQLVLGYINTFTYNTGIEVYWENYNNTYYPNCFIFIDKKCQYNTIEIHSKISLLPETPFTNPVVILPSVTITSSFSYITKPNRLSESEKEPDMMASNYATTDVHSPISYLGGTRLYVKYNTTFYPHSLIIQYLRKPRLISLSLNQTNEVYYLNDELIARCAEKIKSRINDNNYNVFQNQNLKQE